MNDNLKDMILLDSWVRDGTCSCLRAVHLGKVYIIIGVLCDTDDHKEIETLEFTLHELAANMFLFPEKWQMELLKGFPELENVGV